MPFRAVLCAVALAAVLAGCGTASSSSSPKFTAAEQAVADKVGDLSSAGRQNKPADICDDVLASALKERVTATGSTCNAEMKKAIEDADGFDMDVKDVTITGSEATARVTSSSGSSNVTRTLRLAREGSGWRVTSFG